MKILHFHILLLINIQTIFTDTENRQFLKIVKVVTNFATKLGRRLQGFHIFVLEIMMHLGNHFESL